jgi:dolichol-phosphate mannosyltransferase
MKSLIIIPTYNERENIGILLDKIISLNLSAVDVLVVDDNSPDKTADIVRAKQKGCQNIFLLERPGKDGLGRAYIAGFSWGLKNYYDLLIGMDADLSHDPKYLPSLIKGLETNDFVVGSRYVSGGGIDNWGYWRRFLSIGGNIYAGLVLSMKIKDLTGGFNAWRAEVLKTISLETVCSDGYSFLIELKYRACKNNFKYLEVPIIFKERASGKSKMSSSIIKEALWRLPYLRFKNRRAIN